MPEVFSNTSPLQYLHQAGQLAILPALVGRVFVPPAVVAELSAGRAKGVDLPDVGNLIWVNVREPFSLPALPSMKDLGPGETEVLALALETQDAVVLLDDAVATLYQHHLVGKELVISFMTLAELLRWALSRSWGKPRMAKLEEHVRKFAVHPFDVGLCRI